MGCAKSENKIYFDDFKWTLLIPNEFAVTPTELQKKSQQKGIKLIESAYPDKNVNIVAKNLFHFRNGKYNTVQAQFKELSSNQNFIDEFNRSNEIVVKSFKNKRPNSEVSTTISNEIIDNLEFKTFEMKTINDDFKFKVYSRMFGNKHLNIITVSNEKEKSQIIENMIIKSQFD